MKYTSRKFIVTVMTIVSAHWALIESLIDGSDYKALMLGALAIYGAANVGQKAVAKEPTA